MNKYTRNKHWACEEKKCWWCCDPIKISFRKWYDPSRIIIPKDKDNNPLWIAKEEIRVPETDIDTRRIQIYECLLYDKDKKICKEYENRPDICRNTSCIDEFLDITIDEQHKKLIETNFIKIKK